MAENMQSIFKQRPPRKFFCDFQDCGKSFTRAEHLQRHELNHRDSPNTCARCSAHFARPDLLGKLIFFGTIDIIYDLLCFVLIDCISTC